MIVLTNAVKSVTAVTTPTDHVTTDVVQAGQEALVKNVSKIYIDKLKDSTIQKIETYILVECVTTFPNVCQKKKMEKDAAITAENVFTKTIVLFMENAYLCNQ